MEDSGINTCVQAQTHPGVNTGLHAGRLCCVN